jgi:hypothetical protein
MPLGALIVVGKLISGPVVKLNGAEKSNCAVRSHEHSKPPEVTL